MTTIAATTRIPRPVRSRNPLGRRFVRSIGAGIQPDITRRGLFELTSPDAIADVMNATVQAGAVLSVTAGSTSATAIAERWSEQTLLLETDLALTVEQAVILRWTSFGVLFHYEGRIVGGNGGRLLARTERLFTVSRRRLQRARVPEGTGQLAWSPNLVGGELQTLEVLDITPEGAKCRCAQEIAPLTDDFVPARLKLNGRSLHCLVSRTHGDRRGVVGVLLSDAREPWLVDACLSFRFPRLQHRRTATRQEIESLLRQSGYFGLRAGQVVSHDWHQLENAEPVSRDVIYRARDGTVIGHTSVTRFFQRSWIVQQLATIRGHEETDSCRLAVYQYFDSLPAMLDGDDTHIVAYFNRDKPWHKVFVYGFNRWVNNPDHNSIWEVDRFERQASDGPEVRLPPRSAVSVADLQEEELLEATVLIRSQVPKIHARAFDIHPERLNLECAHKSYRETPYERGRRALGLRVNGRLMGVALCETGSQTLSLFNIFNIAHLFFRVGAKLDVGDQLQLVYAARDFYRSCGKQDPIVVAPVGTFSGEAEPGTRKAETMGCVAWGGPALRQYEDFLSFQFGKHRRERRAQ